MLAGGSTNFESSFFIPNDHNLAQFFAEHGYLVIGLTAREDNAPSNAASYRFMEGWGLQKHSADARSIVEKVQAAVGVPYEMLGHSYGAFTTLDYAARYTDSLVPERVIALDIYSLDPGANPSAQSDASRTFRAHAQLLANGEYVDKGYSQLKPVAAFARSTPMLSSGVSRADHGHAGTFTFEGLLFATLIDNSKVDGVHTSITGLPGDWLFKGGVCAGRYLYADDPRNDRYAFTRTRFQTMMATTEAAGSGLISIALERDVWAVNAADSSYPFDWAAIRQPVIWINTEFGYGVHRHGAALMRKAGNANVVDDQLAGYGHGDILWGETARHDLWERLLP
jgi:pimeloyl-ACP methyl ester carboxylesterase